MMKKTRAQGGSFVRIVSFVLGLVGSVASLIVIFRTSVMGLLENNYAGPTNFTASYWLLIVFICLICSIFVLNQFHFNAYLQFIFGLNLASISIVEFMHGMHITQFQICFVAGLFITLSGIFDHLYKKSHKI